MQMKKGNANFFRLLAAVTLGSILGALVGTMSVTQAVPNAPAPPPESETEEPTRYERRDLPARPLLKIGVGFLAVTLLVLVLVTSLQFWFMGSIALPQPFPPQLVPPPNVTLPAQPRFEAVPGAARNEIQAHADAQLNSYGWIDQAAGIAHIPIERAMELTQPRLPVAPQDAGKTFEDAGNVLPSGSSSGRVPQQVFP